MLWSAVFIVGLVLQRPVEQLLSRTISEHIARGTPIGHTVRVAATIQLGVAIGFVVDRLALRGPIEDGLLDGNATLYWIGVGAVTAYGASYFARGFLAGSHRLTLYAPPDHLGVGLAHRLPARGRARDRLGTDAVALGIVAAPTLSLIVVPFAFLRGGAARRGGRRSTRPEQATCRARHAGVHPRPGRRLRGGGVPDHAQRADLPQRRDR